MDGLYIKTITFNPNKPIVARNVDLIKQKYPHINVIKSNFKGNYIIDTIDKKEHLRRDADVIINHIITSINNSTNTESISFLADDLTLYHTGNTPSNENVVYTCITGKYDTLKDPTIIDSTWDYVCFTDNPTLKSNVWKVCLIPEIKTHQHKHARKVKTLFHLYVGEYKNILWVDASYTLISRPSDFIPLINPSNLQLAVSHHGVRDCIYDEGVACINLGKDLSNTINTQLTKYRRNGYPPHNGLAETGILFRKNVPEIIDAMLDWWKEISEHSVRDQLSFNYVMWKHATINWELFPHNLKENIGKLNKHTK
jgi:hypothetical protein